MKSLKNLLLEALDLKHAKEYTDAGEDKSIRIVKYQKYFFDRVMELHKDAFLSRNGYRLYLPYTLDSKQEASKDEQISKIEQDVLNTLQNNGYYIKDKDDYIKNKCYKKVVTQRGEKEVQYNIAKVLNKCDKDIKNAFDSDPNRDHSKNDNKCYLCFSTHGYDVAGMSTGRDWTSCMNIIDGCNKQYVKQDIKYGTIICYLINKDDMNINKPLCRVLIKPRKLNGRDNDIVYYPEVSVYGIQGYISVSLIEYLEKLCDNVYSDKHGKMSNFSSLYNDGFHILKSPNRELNMNILDTDKLSNEVLAFGKKIKNAKYVIARFYDDTYHDYYVDYINYDKYIKMCKTDKIYSVDTIKIGYFLDHEDKGGAFEKFFDELGFIPDINMIVYDLKGPTSTYSSSDKHNDDSSFFETRTYIIILDK